MRNMYMDLEIYKVEPLEVREHPAQHIVMIRPDILNTDSDTYFIEIAKAFQDFGHRVTIITCSRNSGAIHKELENIYIMETFTWIPRTIYGQFRYPLYLVRTLAAVLTYVTSRRIRPRPSVVFCNGSCLALPILTLDPLDQHTIRMQIQHPKEYQNSNNKLFNWLLRKSLNYSHEIIVPDNSSKKLFQRNCATLHPCVDLALAKTKSRNHFNVKDIVPNFPITNGFLFCCFGDYYVQSNFELALAAFCISLNMLKKYSDKMHLVIGGNYNPKDQQQKEYLSKIKRLVYVKMYTKNITLLESLSGAQKKCLMFEARAILEPTLEGDFNGTILEAMCLAKTVIATNCSFAKEVLIHQITGYLVAPNPMDFAEIIDKLINNKVLPVYIGNLAETEFRYKYSYPHFSNCINRIVFEHTAKYTFNG